LLSQEDKVESAVKLVHVYRRDDGDYVLTTKWRRTVPGCSDVFSYLGVCRWPGGDKSIDRQLKDHGSVVISLAQFRASIESLKPQLRLVRDSGSDANPATASRSGGNAWLASASQQPGA
jgi:hypothetical protein